MKTRSNHIPDCIFLEFKENSQRKNIYDLNSSSKTFTKFTYFRLEQPRQYYLIKQGAKYVCESWKNKIKILHTGLIPIGIENFYFGDFVETKTKGDKIITKISLIIFYFIPETSTIECYFFNSYNKNSIRMKLNFCKDYINYFIKKRSDNNHPFYCSNQITNSKVGNLMQR